LWIAHGAQAKIRSESMPAERTKPRRPDQLPPGRHGIPREQIVESQRTRMLQAVLDAVAAQGYQDTRVTDIIGRAGVSRKTFYEHFDEKEECFLAAYDRELAQLTEEVASAFFGDEGTARRWTDQVRDGVGAFLRYLAEHPAAARVCMVDAMGAGPTAIAKREAALRNFTYLIDAGRSEAKFEVPGRTAVAVLGGSNELIAGELIHGSAANVETLAPDIVYLITLPFLGPKAAVTEREKTRKALEAAGISGRPTAKARSEPA
jgi:AcrR family transcriptional regulator